MLALEWCCGIDFIEASPPILNYSGRIHELRKDGWLIDRRECESHGHGPGVQMWEWRITAPPQPLGDPLRMFEDGRP